MVASAVSRGKKPVDAAVGELDEHTALEEGQFRELLEKIDRGLRALPATAQARRWAADRHAGRFNRVACMGAGARFGQLWFLGQLYFWRLCEANAYMRGQAMGRV